MRSWLKTNRDSLTLVLQAWAGSRVLLVVTAWFASYFEPNGIYQRYVDRGYFLSPKWLIDIWCRWDSEWHFSIVRYGYYFNPDAAGQYTNIAFFPLYPYLIRLLSFWMPARLQTESVYLLIGLVLSNLCFIAALWGIYQLARKLFDEAAASRTVLLYVCLPAGFFFSAFYSEGLFLCCITYAFYFAEKQRWSASAIFAMLAGLTRPHGVLILIPMAWIYLHRHGWNLRRLSWQWLWYLLVPAAIAVYFLGLQRLTGNFFAFFEAQASWGRSLGVSFFSEYLAPLQTRLAKPAALDLVFIILSLLLSIAMLMRVRQKAYGLYALASVVVLILTGNLFSMTRYCAAIFPLVIFVAANTKRPRIFMFICGLCAMLQTLYFCGWVNYYWID